MKVIKIRRFSFDTEHLKSANYIVIASGTAIIFYRNGKIHNENFYAKIYMDGNKAWYYKGEYYFGSTFDIAFTNKTWKQTVKEFKRKERLEIFK